MAEAGEELFSPESGEDYLGQARSSRFRVINRIAATKPIEDVYTLLGTKGAAENDYAEMSADEETDEIATIRVSSFMRPKLFGLRIGVRLEDDEHLIAVDATVEYQWDRAVAYVPDPMTDFLRGHVSPRVVFGIWAIIEELGCSLTVEAPEPPPFLVDGVVRSVRRQMVEQQAAGH
ncbi:hypothetical protein [Mycolicibacterium nivoides]|uniref:Preprotein translocase subunit SecB n=1 Tax=Mycolicibacterium nivoides TaxID=2487344 RepID=A0ABW9L9V6_9MYCO